MPTFCSVCGRLLRQQDLIATRLGVSYHANCYDYRKQRPKKAAAATRDAAKRPASA